MIFVVGLQKIRLAMAAPVVPTTTSTSEKGATCWVNVSSSGSTIENPWVIRSSSISLEFLTFRTPEFRLTKILRV